MIERTRIFSALQGLRGHPPVDLAALEQLMVRFSQLVVEQRWIREIEINPLLVGSQQITALDARVVLYGPEVTEEALPRPAIRPYPTQYIRPFAPPSPPPFPLLLLLSPPFSCLFIVRFLSLKEKKRENYNIFDK